MLRIFKNSRNKKKYPEKSSLKYNNFITTMNFLRTGLFHIKSFEFITPGEFAS